MFRPSAERPQVLIDAAGGSLQGFLSATASLQTPEVVLIEEVVD